MNSARICAFVLTVVVLLMRTPAWGDSSETNDNKLRDLAQNHITVAQNSYEKADYDLALTEYEAAFQVLLKFSKRDLDAECDLLNNLSRTNEKLGDYAKAIEQAERYLRESPTVTQRERDEHAGRIARMRKELAPPVKPSTPVLDQRPVVRRRKPPGALALTIGGGGFLLASLGCGIGLAATAQALSGSLTQRQIDGLVTQGQSLEGLTIAFGAIGIGSEIGGIVWLVRSSRNTQ